MTPLVLVLMLSFGAEKKIDCDKICAQAADACALSCKKKKKEHDATAKQCDAQCSMVVDSCKETCKGAMAPKNDPAKAMEIKKKLGEADSTPTRKTQTEVSP